MSRPSNWRKYKLISVVDLKDHEQAFPERLGQIVEVTPNAITLNKVATIYFPDIDKHLRTSRVQEILVVNEKEICFNTMNSQYLLIEEGVV